MITSVEQNTGAGWFFCNLFSVQGCAILQDLLGSPVLEWVILNNSWRIPGRSMQHVRNVFSLCYLPERKLYLVNCQKISGHCQQMVYYFCTVLVFPSSKMLVQYFTEVSLPLQRFRYPQNLIHSVRIRIMLFASK